MTARQGRRTHLRTFPGDGHARAVEVPDLCGDRLRLLDIAGLRSRQLNILEQVADFCATHELTYYLCAGTLLGAVRHQGYIPWDDDIDLMLPRVDYERFCRLFSATDGHERLSLRSLATSESYPFPFAKVCDDTTFLEVDSDVVRELGVYIDVFPLDGWNNRVAARFAQLMGLRILALMMRAKHLRVDYVPGRAKRVLLATVKHVLTRLDVRAVARALDRVAQWGRFETSRRCGVLVWGYREAVLHHAYGQPTKRHFEGRAYNCPTDVHEVLSVIYGDYMTPPQAHARRRHRFRAYARAEAGHKASSFEADRSESARPAGQERPCGNGCCPPPPSRR